LQYLENPREILQTVTQSSARDLLIDRIPATELNVDKVSVQMVPPEIYPARYPAWLFSKNSLLKDLGENWDVLSDFQSLGGTTYTKSGDL
jgi:hypothetical protein